MRLDFDISGLTSTFDKLKELSQLTRKDVLRRDTAEALKEIVKATPEDNGFARAGFNTPWAELGLGALPSSQSQGRTQIDREYFVGGIFIEETATYEVSGGLDDNSDAENPHMVIRGGAVAITAEGLMREQLKGPNAAGNKGLKGLRGEARKKRKEEIRRLRQRVKGKRSKVDYLWLLDRGRALNRRGKAITTHKGYVRKAMKKARSHAREEYKKLFDRLK